MKQHSLQLLLLALSATGAPTPARTSRWWFQTHTPEYTEQTVQLVRAHRDSITGVYMYAGLGIDAGGYFNSPSDAITAAKVAPIVALGVTTSIALGIDQASVQNGTWRETGALAEAAALTARHNLTSLMVDYEPKTNITEAHARDYAAFITELAAALHAHGATLDMCVSSWSILDKFALYAPTGVDRMMTMAATYFGSNISKNENWVRQEQAQGVSPAQLSVGIGTMSDEPKWDYNWTEQSFRAFVGWSAAAGVRHIDIWRSDIDTLNGTTAQWVYDAVAGFLEGP